MLLRPATEVAIQQSLGDAVLGGIAGLVSQALILFTLPAIERGFGVTTGMKLIELRDPKQRLLRELQRRAPGTYNHSLNVASIAESAADAIGADALLTYVGGLYHDVGKMSKPEYFIENQSGRVNKHQSLSPAMSLLLIVGHVKDGLEIASEYALPKKLHHFIEAHHGTTLVEYFFYRAQQRAAKAEIKPDTKTEANPGPKPDGESSESDANVAARSTAGGTAPHATDAETPRIDDDRPPEDIDFRYPGPKPRSREVAILMLADAVESATRAMAEPTPKRIEALVRELAQKRQNDGQFDDCELTFRELRIIGDSIAKSVTAIYHGRIQYPAASTAKADPQPADGSDLKSKSA
ncbi:MAG: HDIG domain-containing metalloprotein [Planctomycetota bacterium]